MATIVGVFIEPRKLTQIDKNINNYFDVLPNNKLYFFCGYGLKSYYDKKYNNENLIINELHVNNLTQSTYSDLMKDINFWNKINGDYVLTIQTDGCLCINSNYKIEDFFKYDYVGGYAYQKWWMKETRGLCGNNDFQCFNGGFSLRNISAIKNVILNYPPKPSKKFKPDADFESYYEDLYFVVGLFRLGYNVGIDKYATNFCSHTSFTNKTFCVHKLNRYIKNDTLSKFLDYCPEFKYYMKPIIDKT